MTRPIRNQRSSIYCLVDHDVVSAVCRDYFLSGISASFSVTVYVLVPTVSKASCRLSCYEYLVVNESILEYVGFTYGTYLSGKTCCLSAGYVSRIRAVFDTTLGANCKLDTSCLAAGMVCGCAGKSTLVTISVTRVIVCVICLVLLFGADFTLVPVLITVGDIVLAPCMSYICSYELTYVTLCVTVGVVGVRLKLACVSDVSADVTLDVAADVRVNVNCGKLTVLLSTNTTDRKVLTGCLSALVLCGEFGSDISTSVITVGIATLVIEYVCARCRNYNCFGLVITIVTVFVSAETCLTTGCGGLGNEGRIVTCLGKLYVGSVFTSATSLVFVPTYLLTVRLLCGMVNVLVTKCLFEYVVKTNGTYLRLKTSCLGACYVVTCCGNFLAAFGLATSVCTSENLWEGSFYPRLPGGKRKKFNVYAKTREKCEKKLAKMIAEKKAEIAKMKQAQKKG